MAETSLPVVRSGSTALVEHRGNAIVLADQPPKVVTVEAVKLLMAFPTPGATESDKRIMLDLIHEAVAGFPLTVVLWTQKWLRFHNPRNTPTFIQPPTPQDVREACQRTDRLWRRWVVWFWLGGKWAEPSTDEVIKKHNDDLMARYTAAKQGGDPSEPGCIVPRELQITYLRDEIERQLPEIETSDERMRKGYDSDPLLLRIPDSVLDRIPEVAFPDGALQKIRGIRAARTEAARKAAEHEAYIDSLPDEVRAVRWTVVASAKWKDAAEIEVMAETHRRLEMISDGRAEALTNGGEFTGCCFDDGTEWRESRRLDLRRSARRA